VRRGSYDYEGDAMNRSANHQYGPSWHIVSIFALAAALLAPHVAGAESILKTNSLKFVPEDASFYWSRMRMREQVEAVINSRAIGKILNAPLIKQIREIADEVQAASPVPDGGSTCRRISSFNRCCSTPSRTKYSSMATTAGAN
jgi:hypothetical protein